MNTIVDLVAAYHFAALEHVDQRRKGERAEPYINHLTEVADLLARATGGTDRTSSWLPSSTTSWRTLQSA